ncbi:hypothetical protein HC752_22000 [Vibrio sp. S9_S30]|uniref:hypothetical protein n=1 Tax=Vibrio sp. S9_S30 TaxID=2720226 RepID=UPI0016812D58|nr:hypothetical protein [Vibrio sp. S9_S30]MBD1559621.1 hypothetical protein [Vibrio sp. S9_S30]
MESYKCSSFNWSGIGLIQPSFRNGVRHSDKGIKALNLAIDELTKDIANIMAEPLTCKNVERKKFLDGQLSGLILARELIWGKQCKA